MENPIKKKYSIENKKLSIESYIDNLPKIEGYIDFNQLQKIGSGGSHEVFIYPQNQSFVIKINRGALEALSDLKSKYKQIDIQKAINEYLEEKNYENRQLYECFGENHCLKENIVAEKINITQKIEGIISTQESSDIFENPYKKDFSTSYIERNPNIINNEEIYSQINRMILGKEKFNEKIFLEFNNKPKEIFELIDKDEKFANSVRDFLLKFKQYFETSGKFIDIIGQENVLFYKEKGKWTYKIGSVLKGENKETMEEILENLNKKSESINLNEEIKNQIINYLALTRFIDATSLKVGIKKIINLNLNNRQLTNLNKLI